MKSCGPVLRATDMTRLFVFAMMVPAVLSGAEYVRRGSAITGCGMECLKPWGYLELHRTCGKQRHLMLWLQCNTSLSNNRYKPRLHLNTSSGCWTLSNATKEDSCVYEPEFRLSNNTTLSSKTVIVLDPVLIYNMTSNSSRLGEDFTVSVHYSREESAVTWELEGARLPERYRLIDDNRTLIIPSVQRGDAQRRFRVTVTNRVSEETREYQLSNDPNFQRLLEEVQRQRFGIIFAGVIIVGLIIVLLYQCFPPPKKEKKEKTDLERAEGEHPNNEEYVAIPMKDTCSLPQQDEGFITVSLKEQNCKMKVNKIPAKETLQDFVLTAQT